MFSAACASNITLPGSPLTRARPPPHPPPYLQPPTDRSNLPTTGTTKSKKQGRKRRKTKSKRARKKAVKKERKQVGHVGMSSARVSYVSVRADASAQVVRFSFKLYRHFCFGPRQSGRIVL